MTSSTSLNETRRGTEWTFKKILNHQGPINSSDPRHKGSSYNVQVEWDTGEVSWEPLYTAGGKAGIWKYDPVTVAIYARDNKLLKTKGWKLPGIEIMAKAQKCVVRLANQAKLHSFRTKPIFMYGIQVPRNHDQAMELDEKNGNTLERCGSYGTLTDRRIRHFQGHGNKSSSTS